jgi:competence protein ComFC
MNAVLASVQSWVNAGLAFVYPEVCRICGERRARSEESYVCLECRARVRVIQRPFCERCGHPFQGDITTEFECSNCHNLKLDFEHARSAVLARDGVLEAIRRYKYNRAMWFESFLADLLVEAAAAELRNAGWNWLVPVPLHPTKQRQREFNQAERLARHLGKATGIPVNTRLLKRVLPTETQTHLTREERFVNVRKAFAPSHGASVKGQRIVVIDDVFTTGATTSACAGALRKAGASSVCVWTVARGV